MQVPSEPPQVLPFATHAFALQQLVAPQPDVWQQGCPPPPHETTCALLQTWPEATSWPDRKHVPPLQQPPGARHVLLAQQG